MGTKSLTITEEAYDRLAAMKHEDESFTDAILRLTGRERDRLQGFGLLADDATFRAEFERVRENLDEDLRAREQR